ncbi:DNA starvation/stationary phase protection protein Dps [soil metagenome]|jgi:starvation-inducible DNA-binding protein|nr:DNA starvation/stationary phase protection protein Dps [Deinococcota bacterium]
MARTKTTGTKHLYKTEIDLSLEARRELTDLSNQQLADTFDLYSQTKQAHWNVKGIHFYQLHKLFDELAASVEPFVDVIAERVTSLGGVALGTARMAAANSTLAEFPAEAAQGEEHLKLLVDRYAAYAASSRAASRRAAELDDPTTEDMYIEITRVVDKDLYFLESHLQGK